MGFAEFSQTKELIYIFIVISLTFKSALRLNDLTESYASEVLMSKEFEYLYKQILTSILLIKSENGEKRSRP